MEILLVALVVTSIGISTALRDGPLLSYSNDPNLKVTAYYSCCRSNKVTFSQIRLGDKYKKENTRLGFEVNYGPNIARVYRAKANSFKSIKRVPFLTWRTKSQITLVRIGVWSPGSFLCRRPGGTYASSTPANSHADLPNGKLFSASSNNNLRVTARYSFSTRTTKIIFSSISVAAGVNKRNGLYFRIVYRNGANLVADNFIKSRPRSKETFNLRAGKGKSDIFQVAIGTAKGSKFNLLSSRPAIYLTSGPLTTVKGAGRTTGTYTIYTTYNGKSLDHAIRITNFQTAWPGPQMFFHVRYVGGGSKATLHKTLLRKDYGMGNVDIPLKKGKKDKDVNTIYVVVTNGAKSVVVAKRQTDTSL